MVPIPPCGVLGPYRYPLAITMDTHLKLYEERKNKRAPPVVKPEYTELVERASYDDGWSGYEEPVFDF